MSRGRGCSPRRNPYGGNPHGVLAISIDKSDTLERCVKDIIDNIKGRAAMENTPHESKPLDREAYRQNCLARMMRPKIIEGDLAGTMAYLRSEMLRVDAEEKASMVGAGRKS